MKDINHAQNASAAVLQASVQRRPAGASVSHHLLTTYVRSYLAVIRSQFSCKGVQGRARGVAAPALCCSTLTLTLTLPITLKHNQLKRKLLSNLLAGFPSREARGACASATAHHVKCIMPIDHHRAGMARVRQLLEWCYARYGGYAQAGTPCYWACLLEHVLQHLLARLHIYVYICCAGRAEIG